MPPGMIGRMVSVRLRRQQVLDREDLRLSVVLDESVLKRRIGDESVMYEQLQRLVRDGDRPNLTLQILPLNAQHTVFGESFVIFGFRDSDSLRDDSDAQQDVVITEQFRSSVTLGSGQPTVRPMPAMDSSQRVRDLDGRGLRPSRGGVRGGARNPSVRRACPLKPLFAERSVV
jgi:hypothetical protein